MTETTFIVATLSDVRECRLIDGIYVHVLNSSWQMHQDDPRIERMRCLRELKMSKVSYDFAVDNVITVDAPIGTDPDTLIEQVKQKLIERISEGDITFTFENIFDAETGDYCDEWKNYKR